jgi:hypothetical protein
LEKNISAGFLLNIQAVLVISQSYAIQTLYIAKDSGNLNAAAGIAAGLLLYAASIVCFTARAKGNSKAVAAVIACTIFASLIILSFAALRHAFLSESVASMFTAAAYLVVCAAPRRLSLYRGRVDRRHHD